MSKLVMVTDEIKTILKRESGRKTYNGVSEYLGVSDTWVKSVIAGRYNKIREKLADRVFSMAGIDSKPENLMTAEQLNKMTSEPWFKNALRKKCLNYSKLEPKIQKLREFI